MGYNTIGKPAAKRCGRPATFLIFISSLIPAFDFVQYATDDFDIWRPALHTRALSILALASFATPALALDFGNGFTLSGDVELEYISSNGSTESIGFVDATLGWRSQAGSAVGFGFDLTPVGFSFLDTGDTSSTFWGGLVLTTAVGEVTIGNPRPLLTTMINAPELGGYRILELEFSQITGSTLEVIALQSDEQLYGVSFKGSSGALAYGASYHTVEGSAADILELVATYQLGNILIQSGAETIRGSGTSFNKFLIGATYAADRWSAGVLVSSANALGTDVTTTRLFADYAVSDALTIGAQKMSIDGPFSGSLYGVSAEYGFASGGFAQLGVIGSSPGGDTAYTASIGFRF